MSLMKTLSFITNHPLNKNRKARAVLGFLKWQIGSRMVPGPVVFEWVAGTRVFVRPGETGMTQNLYCGLQEFHDMAYVLHVMQPGDLFIDIGANVGSYTVLACAVRGARGYCFEPVPSTFSRLSDNLRINNLPSLVTAVNIGLSDCEGELRFTVDENTTNHVIDNGTTDANTARVSVRTLDSVLSGESPTFLKIDVEGFETRVLDGAEAILAKPSLHSVLIELNGCGSRYGFDETSILRKMRDHGFSTYSYDPFSRELRPLAGKNPSGDNTLFVRNEQEVRDKLHHAPRIPVGLGEL